MEWFELLRIITPFITLLVTALMAVAGYFGKKMIDGFGHELYKVRKRQEESEKEFLKFQATLPRVYTLKDDHIRHMSILERKVDDLRNETNTSLVSIQQDVKIILREIPKRKCDAEA